jgi:hypothetical protein
VHGKGNKRRRKEEIIENKNKKARRNDRERSKGRVI